MKAKNVLVVEPDEEQRRRIGAWLEEELYDIMYCPGPSAPEYTCLLSRGQPCALERGADLVVLDLNLRSDVAMTGTPGWELLLAYHERGNRIVAVAGESETVGVLPDERVAVVRRPVERDALLAAIRSLDAPAAVVGRGGGVYGHNLAG